jgi:hypothetical protein
MNEPEWKVDKQPAWLVAAIKKRSLIWTVVMQKQLNGWALLKTHCLTAYVPMVIRFSSRLGNGSAACWWIKSYRQCDSTPLERVFVPLADIEEVDNADINQRLMESIEWIGKHSQYLRKATADGVIDQAEREQIEENSYQVMAKWQEHLTLLFRVFCQPEKSDARECAAPGVVADKSTCMEK